LFGVDFFDSDNGVVVGGNFGDGRILITTDGGANWTISGSFPFNTFYGVSFIDLGRITVVGGGTFTTTDGGASWTEQSSGTTEHLWSVSFTDAYNGTAVGDYGTILKTTNGGIPVELTSFTATANGNEVILNWSTATELNNFGFEVQRLTIENVWKKIVLLEGYGTTTETHNYSYVDANLTPGKYLYRLKQIDFNGQYEYSNLVEIELIPEQYALYQNYPNPFNPSTKITYTIPELSFVTIKVYDVLGNEIAKLVNEEKPIGNYAFVEIAWMLKSPN